MLKWAVGVGYITVNPAADIPKPAKERSRERVLSLDEVRAILAACDSLAGVQADFVKFLLFSGQRLNEIAKLTTMKSWMITYLYRVIAINQVKR